MEEFCYSFSKGRIAKLVVSRKDYILKEMKIVLEEPWHLSFPFILRKNDKIYIIPESCKAAVTAVYEYDLLTDSMIMTQIIYFRQNFHFLMIKIYICLISIMKRWLLMINRFKK